MTGAPREREREREDKEEEEEEEEEGRRRGKADHFFIQLPFFFCSVSRTERSEKPNRGAFLPYRTGVMREAWTWAWAWVC